MEQRGATMKRSLLMVIPCLLIASGLWAQPSKDPRGFEGAWTGSFIHHGQAPRNWTYVFQNIHDNTCTGYMWNGTKRTPWARCVIKDGEISLYYMPTGTTPNFSGRILSPTQLEMDVHATTAPTAAERAAGVKSQPEIHKFIATKEPPDIVKTHVDPTQTGGVDRTHMGVYRALADLIMENLKRGDMVSAAKLARILEISWDRGEEDLHTKSPQVWGGIDTAMDDFVLPIIGYQKAAPDPAKVDAARQAFGAKLKDAETTK
jgi:hypothetical protein